MRKYVTFEEILAAPTQNIRALETITTGDHVIDGRGLYLRFVTIDMLSWYRTSHPIGEITEAQTLALNVFCGGMQPAYYADTALWECWVLLCKGNSEGMARFLKKFPQWVNMEGIAEVPLTHEKFLPAALRSE